MVRIPFKPEFFPGFNFTAALVVYTTGMINHVFICFPSFERLTREVFYLSQLIQFRALKSNSVHS